ncbi:MAG TPA: DUF1697 domain-containing protein [Albitalea sp.]
MTRYVAFLRGVSPMNAKMPQLRRCFESAGFTDVKTVLASGNVVFSARSASPGTLERGAEAAMAKELERAFPTIVRPVAALQALLEADPYAEFRLPANAKRVVTFMRQAQAQRLALPIEVEGASILAMRGGEILCAYVPSPRGPAFMTLIEKTFGSGVTTRTWETVRKCVAAAA